jgi:hypothetical protein
MKRFLLGEIFLRISIHCGGNMEESVRDCGDHKR